MTMIIRNNKVYAGSGGGSGNANIVKVTQAEYDALPESKNSDGVLYAITDGESQSAGEDADMVIYTEEDGSKTTVQDKLSELNSNLPFKLGIDENGNYGYIKEGADTVIPFKGIPIVTFLQGKISITFNAPSEKFLMSVTGIANTTGVPTITISGHITKTAKSDFYNQHVVDVTWGHSHGQLWEITATKGASITVKTNASAIDATDMLFVTVVS